MEFTNLIICNTVTEKYLYKLVMLRTQRITISEDFSFNNVEDLCQMPVVFIDIFLHLY